MEIRVQEKIIEDGKFGLFPGASLLLSPFAKILSGLLLAGLLASSVFTLVKVFEVKDLEVKLLTAEKDVDHLQGELEMCIMTVDEQNDEIAKVKIQAEMDMDTVKRANEALNNLTKQQRKEIEKLKSRPAPKDCDETTAWLKDNLDIFEDLQ